jgi:hypothetical protein
MRIWIRNNAYFLANLRICRLGHQGNLRVCDLRIYHYRFAGLQFADWYTTFRNLRICDCRMSTKICGLTKQICVLTFGVVHIIFNT